MDFSKVPWQDGDAQARKDNPLFWGAYDNTKGLIVAGDLVLPSPKGSADYQDYRLNKVNPLMGDASPNDSVTAGQNSAIVDAANYVWTNDPESPHNVAS